MDNLKNSQIMSEGAKFIKILPLSSNEEWNIIWFIILHEIQSNVSMQKEYKFKGLGRSHIERTIS